MASWGSCNVFGSGMTSSRHPFAKLLSQLLLLWSIGGCACSAVLESVQDPCQHPIFCVGGPNSMLDVVNKAQVYNDSKTFVDKPLRFDIDVVLEGFHALMKKTSNDPNREELKSFLDDNFEEVNNELIDWAPPDWNENPEFLSKISDPILIAFGKDLNSRWKSLGRKIKNSVKENEDRHTEIYMEHPFIVPGGRFREMYYWDSYCTILGLLVSNMPDTVKGMLENFVGLVQKYGHIPNGNRIYYINRSQPPLFISMVDIYYKATSDNTFLEENIKVLEEEFQFWLENRSVEVEKDDEKYTLFRYNVNVGTPRPESYLPDLNESYHFGTEADKEEFLSKYEIWCREWLGLFFKMVHQRNFQCGRFSRYENNPNNSGGAQFLLVQKCPNFLGDFYGILGNEEKEKEYRKKEKSIRSAIESVLWNEEEGICNVAPLWAECFTDTRTRNRIRSVMNYLRNAPAMKYLGGVPTSMLKSGQQWDLSNAWPPLQEIVITALENTNDPDAKDMAFNLAQRWTNNNWLTYNNSKKVMFEKFDVEKVGLPGRGGEYKVVEGFGWTNGVMLHLLDIYGDKLKNPTLPISGSMALSGQ
ncbi:TREH [Lepeophtheirus salmonis]|uniref:Trehalase n=1 Tax=Lepeophtheirus salmonis TaxID=72036 RepID=A0A7R8H4H6_LEPSM|nr:TREH [Lepeophtheirus salmonis]CAF2847342.1 TREH [Lepeophtheirus salmonis]